MQNELIYTITGQSERGVVTNYHRKPDALFLNKSKYKTDVAGLKPKQAKNALIIAGGEYVSKFTIGFEIEKNSLHRNAVREYELFCGFERDASCGYEAVTHVLPLLPSGKWRNKVYDIIHKADKIIDDHYSPSDFRCGGHVTIACDGLSGAELNDKVRNYSGIVLALFRKRLKNTYCGANRRLQPQGMAQYNSIDNHNHIYDRYGWHYKYQTALVKGKCLEFRVVSKFESVKQVMRRYELFHELVDFAVNNEGGSFKTFLKRVEPIIRSMYNGDADKTSEVLYLANHFQKFINDGVVSPEIEQYLV
jgi:hypothetical protein